MDDYTKNDCEINYKEMYEQTIGFIRKQAELENLYFDLLKRIGEFSPYMNALTSHMLDLGMADSVRYFKALLLAGEVAKEICDSYGWVEGE